MSALRNGLTDSATLPHGALHPCLTAILYAPNLKTAEKRSILSSWASDMHAVESKPWLRHIPGLGTAIALNDILRALQSLDSDDSDPPKGGGAAMRLASGAQSEPRSNCSGQSLPSKANLATPEKSEAFACPTKARICAHKKNLMRYRRILSTPLTEIERDYVHRRIDEERKALLSLGHSD